MSFSGKKFQRSHCHNINELVKATNTHEIIQTFKAQAPTVCFTRLDESTFHLQLEMASRHLGHTFKLGEELHMERKDGSKVRMTYRLEGDSVLQQEIRLPDGKTAHFRRQFTESDCIMTITLEGTDVVGTIWYKYVEQ